MMNIRKLFEYLCMVWLLVPVFVSAQGKILKPEVVFPEIEAVVEKFCEIGNWIFTFAIVTSVIVVVVAAYQYLTSAGSEEKVSIAHKSLTWAAVGAAVAIVAGGVPFIIAEFVGTSESLSGICGLGG